MDFDEDFEFMLDGGNDFEDAMEPYTLLDVSGDDFNNTDDEATVMTFHDFEAKIVAREQEIEEARRDCTICLDTIEIRGTIDCCTHSFCYECIKQWAKQQKLCPCCKRSFRRIRKSNRTPEKPKHTKPTVHNAAALIDLLVEETPKETVVNLTKDYSNKENTGKQKSKNKKQQKKPMKKKRQSRGRTKAKKNPVPEEVNSEPAPKSTRKTKNGVVWIKNSLTGRWTRGRRQRSQIDVNIVDLVQSQRTPTTGLENKSPNTSDTNTPLEDDSNKPSCATDAIASVDDAINSMRAMLSKRSQIIGD